MATKNVQIKKTDKENEWINDVERKKKKYVHEMCPYAYIYIVAQVAESR